MNTSRLAKANGSPLLGYPRFNDSYIKIIDHIDSNSQVIFVCFIRAFREFRIHIIISFTLKSLSIRDQQVRSQTVTYNTTFIQPTIITILYKQSVKRQKTSEHRIIRLITFFTRITPTHQPAVSYNSMAIVVASRSRALRVSETADCACAANRYRVVFVV